MPNHSILSEDVLQRCAQRAAGYDRENRFFMEDFEDLREANIYWRQCQRNSVVLD